MRREVVQYYSLNIIIQYHGIVPAMYYNSYSCWVSCVSGTHKKFSFLTFSIIFILSTYSKVCVCMCVQFIYIYNNNQLIFVRYITNCCWHVNICFPKEIFIRIRCRVLLLSRLLRHLLLPLSAARSAVFIMIIDLGLHVLKNKKINKKTPRWSRVNSLVHF